jgi:hypothetical protein
MIPHWPIAFTNNTLIGKVTTPASIPSSTTAVASSTITSSSQSLTAPSSGGGGYSISDKIALGCGIGIGLPTTITGIVTLYWTLTRGGKTQ